MRLGIRSGYLEHYGLSEGAAKMRAHGYDGLDYQRFVDTTTDFFNLPEREFEAQIKKERAVFEDVGLIVHQAHGPWRSPKDATEADRAERFAAMSKAIRGCAYLGTDRMVLHPLMPYGIKSGEKAGEQYKINFDFMSALADVGAEYGITVCFENMPFPLLPIHSAVHVADFVRKVDHPYFKVCLDTGHCIRCGESLGDAVRYIGKELLYALHVHDNDGKGDGHWLPGEGVGDFEDFGKALAEIGYDGVFSFETYVTKRKGYEEAEHERYERELVAFGRRIADLKFDRKCNTPLDFHGAV